MLIKKLLLKKKTTIVYKQALLSHVQVCKLAQNSWVLFCTEIAVIEWGLGQAIGNTCCPALQAGKWGEGGSHRYSPGCCSGSISPGKHRCLITLCCAVQADAGILGWTPAV